MATWVITGGNRGIGKEFINQLLLKNHTVITGVRNPEQMDGNHELLHVVELDVSDSISVIEFAHSVAQHTSQVDVLVNNAGRMDGRWQSIDEVDADALANTMEEVDEISGELEDKCHDMQNMLGRFKLD